jgi:acyl-CoA hydrolase
MSTGSREITLRFMAAPTDVATLGGTAIAGGRVLEWIDKAAYACAVGWGGGYCVTAYVGNVNFARPIESGDVVEVLARLVHTGRSSMHVEVTVSSADPQRGDYAFATSCTVIFVAVGDSGRPIPVTQWVPVTDDDRERDAMAVDKTAVRADIEAAMKEQAYTAASAAPEATLRFLRRLEWPGLHCRLFRWHPVLPTDPDRPHRRGPGPPAAHRAQQHARVGTCPIRRSQGPADAVDHPLSDDFRGAGRAGPAVTRARMGTAARGGPTARRPCAAPDATAGQARPGAPAIDQHPLAQQQVSAQPA